MSSYFDYFCNNIENNEASDIGYIKGTCYAMCPQDEIRLREREKLVHILEVIGPARKLVKSYSRSAADSNMAVPRQLRPYNVLRDTVLYLLHDVTKRTDVPISVVYDFVNDRLRAVRQDMTIQRLMSRECVNLLEPMVRFYVFFGYKLHGLPIKDYDPILNKKYLLECIKWFLNCSDALDMAPNGNMDELTGYLTDMNINNGTEHRLVCDRVVIESLYIMCNLDHLHPLLRYINLSKDLKTNPSLQLAYKVAIANLKGNYIQVCNLLDRLCPLTYCALCLYLPTLQRNALQVMSVAYSSKRLAVPGAVLRHWLRFASEWEARAVCHHYGLPVDGTEVRFDKGEFREDAPMHQPKIQLLHEGYVNITSENIFNYTTNR